MCVCVCETILWSNPNYSDHGNSGRPFEQTDRMYSFIVNLIKSTVLMLWDEIMATSRSSYVIVVN